MVYLFTSKGQCGILKGCQLHTRLLLSEGIRRHGQWVAWQCVSGHLPGLKPVILKVIGVVGKRIL